MDVRTAHGHNVCNRTAFVGRATTGLFFLTVLNAKAVASRPVLSPDGSN